MLFTELMQALSRHLRPAPYQYGLLTLRLLGKLGGKNRLFLRNCVELFHDIDSKNRTQSLLSLQCSWPVPKRSDVESSEHQETPLSGEYSLPLPIDRCVEVLKQIASLQRSDKSREKVSSVGEEVASPEAGEFAWNNERLQSSRIEDVDLSSYCSNVMDETCHTQAKSAFHVVRAALTAMIAVDSKFDFAEIDEGDVDQIDQDKCLGAGLRNTSHAISSSNINLKQVCLGLMYSCVIDDTMNEATYLLKGLASHCFFLILSHHKSFIRIDANGAPSQDSFTLENAHTNQMVEENTEAADSAGKSQDETHEGGHKVREKTGTLKPFGYFQMIQSTADPLMLSEAIADFLADPSIRTKKVGLELLRHLVLHAKQYQMNEDKESPMEIDTDSNNSTRPIMLHRGSCILFENICSLLCLGCLANEWNKRDGLHEGICLLLEALGRDWGLRYECEIMNATLSALKSVPRELSTAVVKAFKFFIRVCCGLYGRPPSVVGKDDLIWDSLAVRSWEKNSKDAEPTNSDEPASSNIGTTTKAPCSTVSQIFLTELASSRQIVR